MMLNKGKKDFYEEIDEEANEETAQSKINYLLIIAVIVVTICAAVVFYQNYIAASCC